MAAPPALAAARAVGVLNYLTANPRRSFTLSELSAALGVSLASMSSVLTALTDAGYLVRHRRHKTYELGPALVAAGTAAAVRHRVVDLARPEMRRLAAEVSAECVGSALVGDDILLMAIEGRPAAPAHDLLLGQRVPLLPPIGQVFLAWSPPDRVSGWMSAVDEHLDDAARAHLRGALATVRRRGYSINLNSGRLAETQHVVAQVSRRPLDVELRRELARRVSSLGPDYELLDPEPGTSYDVGLIAAPVFGTDGSVVFVLTLLGLGRMDGGRIVRTAHQLTAATRVLTRQIGGRPRELDGELQAVR